MRRRWRHQGSRKFGVCSLGYVVRRCSASGHTQMAWTVVRRNIVEYCRPMWGFVSWTRGIASCLSLLDSSRFYFWRGTGPKTTPCGEEGDAAGMTRHDLSFTPHFSKIFRFWCQYPSEGILSAATILSWEMLWISCKAALQIEICFQGPFRRLPPVIAWIVIVFWQEHTEPSQLLSLHGESHLP